MNGESLKIYYEMNGQRNGPVSDEEFYSYVSSGAVGPQNLVWVKGMADWIAASDAFPHYFPAFSPEGQAATQETVTVNHEAPLRENVIAAPPGAELATLPTSSAGRSLKLQIASPWLRLAALILDGLIIYAPIQILIAFTAVFSAGLSLLINPIGHFLYGTLLISSPLQATLGMKLLGLRAVDEHGGNLSFGRAALRALCSFLSGLIFLIGYLMAFFTRKNQTLHDMMTGTLVIRGERL